MQQLLKSLPVFGRVDHVGRSADDRHAVGFEVERELQGRLAAVLHDHAEGLFLVDDFQHVLKRQRLEVQAVAGVVVGRNRLGIAVDHDGLVAVLAHCHGGMYAAVVELDTLADAVGAAAEHHDLFLVRRQRFAFAALGLVG